MKKTLLAAAAGFVVAFGVGFVSTPATAQGIGPSCKFASDCVAYGQKACPGDPVVCTTGRYCVCA